MSRNEKPLHVKNCSDKNETLLRLAFLAALSNFNTLLDVDITHKKVRDEVYQKTMWFGTGVPLKLNEKANKKYV